MKRDKDTVYIASCSFGKDSIANLLLAIENKEPLDLVLYSEVMFDLERNISAEDPMHIKWVYEEAIPKLEAMGLKVVVVRDDIDYLQQFHKVRKRGNYVGKCYGFPMKGRCEVSKRKLRPITKFLKQFKGKRIVQYIGIAKDEPRRLKRLKDGKLSLLDKYGYTEQMAMDLARKYGLLSPIYNHCLRTGCWFCPNRKIFEYAYFKRNYPQLWEELVKLGDNPNMCRCTYTIKETIGDIDQKVNQYLEENNETLLQIC